MVERHRRERERKQRRQKRGGPKATVLALGSLGEALRSAAGQLGGAWQEPLPLAA